MMGTGIPNEHSMGEINVDFIKNNSYVLLVVVLCVIFTVVGIYKAETEVAYEKVTVAEGDTLWAYSIKYANNVPKDKWIKEIVSLNNLSSTTIRVGDELRIPGESGFNHNDIVTHIAGDEE